MPILIIPLIFFALFGINSLVSFLFTRQVLEPLGFAINFLFSWGFIDVQSASVFSGIYQMLNICKVLLWVSTIAFFIWQLQKHYKKSKYVTK